MPTILLLDGAGGRHGLYRYQSLLSAGALAAAALLLAQASPACGLGTQEAALLPSGNADVQAVAVRQPAARKAVDMLSAAEPDNSTAQGSKATDAVPLCGKAATESRITQPTEHCHRLPMPVLPEGYAAKGTTTGKMEALRLNGKADGSAGEAALPETAGAIPPTAGTAVPLPCETCEAIFSGAVDGVTHAAAGTEAVTEPAALGQLEDKTALPLQKGATAKAEAAEAITVLSLAGLSLVPDWEYPVQQGSTLTITQAYSAVPLGDTLEVT